MNLASYEGRQRFIKILCEEWAKGTRIVESKDLYQRFQSEGITLDPRELHSFLRSLEMAGYIYGLKFSNTGATDTHGEFVIAHIDDSLCGKSWPENRSG